MKLFKNTSETKLFSSKTGVLHQNHRISNISGHSVPHGVPSGVARTSTNNFKKTVYRKNVWLTCPILFLRNIQLKHPPRNEFQLFCSLLNIIPLGRMTFHCGILKQ